MGRLSDGLGRRELTWALAASLVLLSCATGGPTDDSLGAQAVREADTYSQETVLAEAEKLFGSGAAGLGALIEKAFREQGRPSAFIAGEEGAAAWIGGLRYGRGDLKTRGGESRPVYWRGPSLGFDWGANGSKVFVLIYNLSSAEELFQRYPGVDGSLYFFGGLGMNYNQRGSIVLAPIRTGVGWRQGINVGYLALAPHMSIIPF
jgi:hypothetical protein